MTPRCVNCIHWDEEEADERGFAPCGRIKNDDLGPNDGELALTEEICMHNPRLLVRGDFGCVLHSHKVATAGTGKPL